MIATDTDMAMTARLTPMSPASASTNAPRHVSSRTSPASRGPIARRSRRRDEHVEVEAI